jgi:hypothetical protein
MSSQTSDFLKWWFCPMRHWVVRYGLRLFYVSWRIVETRWG